MKICQSPQQTTPLSCTQPGSPQNEALLYKDLNIPKKQAWQRTLIDKAKQQLLTLHSRNNKHLKQQSKQKQHNSELLQQKQNSQALNQSQKEQSNQEQRRKSSNRINSADSTEFRKLHNKLDSIQKRVAELRNNLQKKKLHPQIPSAHTQLQLSTLVTQEPEKSDLHYPTNQSISNQYYYVSELLRAYHDQRSLAREHLNSTLSILKMIDLTKKPTDQEMKKCELRLPLKAGCQGKKTLVFDLDQTLVHCNYSPAALCDVRLPIKTGTGEVIEAAINVRPYAKQILCSLSKYFEIVIFTASHSSYASVVIDYLDQKKEWVHHRLFRQHCLLTSQGLYIKDLRVMNRELKNTILVDNAAYSYAYQLENAVPILPYYHGGADWELRKLEKYLMGLWDVQDVREEICKTFKVSSYREYLQRPQALVEQLYMSQ